MRGCISCLGTPLCHWFNLIMQTSTFPECLKIARVCAIHKSGSKSDIKNYRPVAIIPNFAKLFQIILSNNVYSHIMPVISNSQHGFMKGRSTCTNLAEFTQLVSNALNLKKQIDVIYTDLSKAFDTVNHKLMLEKLRLVGMCDSLVSLFKSILIGQKQFVEYQGYRSYVYECSSGVCQGSNLGPLLFLIFMNDVVAHFPLYPGF